MDWTLVKAHVECPVCGRVYYVSFNFKGLSPCLPFKCLSCREVHLISPPSIAPKVCGRCTQRIECLVWTSYKIYSFRIDGYHIHFWNLNTSYFFARLLSPEFLERMWPNCVFADIQATNPGV